MHGIISAEHLPNNRNYNVDSFTAAESKTQWNKIICSYYS